MGLPLNGANGNFLNTYLIKQNIQEILHYVFVVFNGLWKIYFMHIDMLPYILINTQ